MSYQEAEAPVCTGLDGAIRLRIVPRERDLGEFSVRRVLPSPELKMVGPFVFFDHMGPAAFAPGKGIQVRPHPHIGIATITYLFEGEIMHRDSLGVTQAIRQGAVNLMTAGSGIVHSERAGADLDTDSTLHGIQSWIALPTEKEEIAPAFKHYPASEIPALESGGASVRVIMGEAYGQHSPVMTYSSTLYLDCQLPATSELVLPGDYPELAVYVVSGRVLIDGAEFGPGVMAVAGPDGEVRLRAAEESRVMVIGGDPLGERHLWWNFVSSSTERLERAKRDWKDGRFATVPGDPEFIPLPE